MILGGWHRGPGNVTDQMRTFSRRMKHRRQKPLPARERDRSLRGKARRRARQGRSL